MALGVALGEVERSRLRVLRMIGTMAAGGNAFGNDLNRFDRVLKPSAISWRGGSAVRSGGTQCLDRTGCDVSTRAGVSR
jgi:hypothetical protein